MKLLQQKSLLPSLMLPSALATEAYQLPFDLSSLFGESLSALLEKAGEVASQKRYQSLEEAMIKSANGTKGSKPASKRSAPSGGQQKQGSGKTRKQSKKLRPKLGGKATPKGALSST